MVQSVASFAEAVECDEPDSVPSTGPGARHSQRLPTDPPGGALPCLPAEVAHARHEAKGRGYVLIPCLHQRVASYLALRLPLPPARVTHAPRRPSWLDSLHRVVRRRLRRTASTPNPPTRTPGTGTQKALRWKVGLQGQLCGQPLENSLPASQPAGRADLLACTSTRARLTSGSPPCWISYLSIQTSYPSMRTIRPPIHPPIHTLTHPSTHPSIHPSRSICLDISQYRSL